MPSLKILHVNNYGYIRGGSDRYFFDAIGVLRKAGHAVIPFTSCSDRNTIDQAHCASGFNIDSPRPLDLPSFFYSKSAAAELDRLIREQKPDVAHLHIYYGQLTSSIVPVLRSAGIPIVQTLHEYKLLCPVATMMRNGRRCDLCSAGNFWHAARHRCNRESLARSVVTAAEAYVSRRIAPPENIDRFIAVSEFVRAKFIEYGLSSSRVATVHNFVRDEAFGSSGGPGKYLLYFGRLEAIKGLSTLIRAMAKVPDVQLLIAGEGGDRSRFEAEATSAGCRNVRFVGFKAGDELRDLIAGSICVVSPSEWDEPFGLVLIESFAQGRPVVASRIGGMTEIVTHGVDGFLFEPGDDATLAAHLNWMARNRSEALEMGRAGYRKARARFSADAHCRALEDVYMQVLRN